MTKFSFKDEIKIDQIRALDQNSNKPFLSYKFSKIFEDLITMPLFTKITHIYFEIKWAF